MDFAEDFISGGLNLVLKLQKHDWILSANPWDIIA